MPILDNDNNGEYQDLLKNRINLPVPTAEPTIAQLVKEGLELLKQDELKSKSSKLSTASSIDSINNSNNTTNNYIRARNMIFDKWLKHPEDNWKIKEILNLEKNKNTSSRIYSEFITEVIALAETLENKKK